MASADRISAHALQRKWQRQRLREMTMLFEAAADANLFEYAFTRAELKELITVAMEAANKGPVPRRPSRSQQFMFRHMKRIVRNVSGTKKLERLMLPVLGQYLIELLDRHPEFRAQVLPYFEEFLQRVPWEHESEAAAAARLVEKWKAM